MSEPDAALWEAIDVIGGGRARKERWYQPHIGATHGSHNVSRDSDLPMLDIRPAAGSVAEIHGTRRNLSPTRSSY